MTSIEFTVPGDPVGKGRPRVAKRGKFAHLYTPEKTVAYEGLVAMAAQEAMDGQAALLDGPVAVRMDIRLSVPASWSKKKRAQALDGLIHPTKKPDIDNIEKAIFDALNGVVWNDDVQVCRVFKFKKFAEFPGVHVQISPITGA